VETVRFIKQCLALIISLLIAVVLQTEASAQMYKWVDDKGRTHYSESPPPDQFKSLEIKGEIMEMTSEVPDIEFYQPPPNIRKKPLPRLRKGEVWMFSTPTCGFCVRAKDYFRLNKIAYKELDITKNEEYRHWFKAFGGRGVPFTVVGAPGAAKTLSGFSEARFDNVFSP
jgi:glutaredoxin